MAMDRAGKWVMPFLDGKDVRVLGVVGEVRACTLSRGWLRYSSVYGVCLTACSVHAFVQTRLRSIVSLSVNPVRFSPTSVCKSKAPYITAVSVTTSA